MDLSRQEYPALLSSLQPAQAVGVLNDRVSLITKINTDIADWLQDRRKVEEAYAAGLRKLARRPQQDGAASLGIFQMPWQRIVSGTENLAQSHETLAAKIQTDVETPLRHFAIKNREMTSMTTIQGNLASISKDVESAQKKVDKLRDRSRKPDQQANAASSVDGASREWETQAPYVFEKLQALDETRVNHLRDVLTQFQTHEIDQIERNRLSAESCLNALLNVETADEIKTFAARVSGGRGNVPRRASTVTTGSNRPISAAGVPPLPPPPRGTDDRSRQQAPQQSFPNGEDTLMPLKEKKSSFGGIKRLSTVIGRRKSQQPVPPPTTERSSKRNTRSFAPFRRGDSSNSFQDLEETGRDLTPSSTQERRPPLAARQQSLEQTITQDSVSPAVNGTYTQPNTNMLPLVNTDSLTGFEPPPGPPPSQMRAPQELSAAPATPAIGSPASFDAINQAQQEASLAAGSADGEDSARNLLIRDKPIQEDETEAQAAMSNMANQLRMQAPSLGRVQGSIRGRRDVRNSVFTPSAPQAESTVTGMSTGTAAIAGAGVGAAAVAGAAGIEDLASPIKSPGTPGTIPEEPHPSAAAAQTPNLSSDATSLHSAHSLANQVQHPDLHAPGLNASIIETVSTWFGPDSAITKSLVVGEIALAHNGLPEDSTERIRLENFQALEKVAANPVFVSQSSKGKGIEGATDEEAGEYTISLAMIRKSSPTVGFKYQVHLEEGGMGAYSPVLVSPAWQCQEGQVSVIVQVKLNPRFLRPGPVVLRNVVVTVKLAEGDGAGRAGSAMMMPTAGASFKRKAGAVVWRMGELKLQPSTASSEGEGGGEGEQLLVRFILGGGVGVPGRGTVDLKWDVESNTTGVRMLGVKRLAEEREGLEADPFADESEAKTPGGEGERSWLDVSTKRKLASGKYCAL